MRLSSTLAAMVHATCLPLGARPARAPAYTPAPSQTSVPSAAPPPAYAELVCEAPAQASAASLVAARIFVRELEMTLGFAAAETIRLMAHRVDPEVRPDHDLLAAHHVAALRANGYFDALALIYARDCSVAALGFYNAQLGSPTGACLQLLSMATMVSNVVPEAILPAGERLSRAKIERLMRSCGLFEQLTARQAELAGKFLAATVGPHELFLLNSFFAHPLAARLQAQLLPSRFERQTLLLLCTGPAWKAALATATLHGTPPPIVEARDVDSAARRARACSVQAGAPPSPPSPPPPRGRPRVRAWFNVAARRLEIASS